MSAVLLLGAGLGERLRPLTNDRPKCVVEIAGEPLAVRILRQFAARGVTEATVVVGHFAARARELIGTRIASLAVTFVDNTDYATTNTMYSTLLGIGALAGGGYLVEGDIAASDAAIDRLVAADPRRSHWAVERWTDAHSGCQLRDDGRGTIAHQAIVRDKRPFDPRHTWKSAGMLKLTPRGAMTLARCLNNETDRRIYYDDVIGKHVTEHELGVLDLDGAPWVEIDDNNDMAQARRLFEERAA
jgi:choline kinase